MSYFWFYLEIFMRLLSAFLMGVLVVGAVHVASAETNCVGDVVEPEDWNSFGVPSLGSSSWGLGGVSLGSLSCSLSGFGIKPTEPFCRQQRDSDITKCQTILMYNVEEADALLAVCNNDPAPDTCRARMIQDQQQVVESAFQDCMIRAHQQFILCNVMRDWARRSTKSARLPQKTCRANAKHGKQARAGFKQTQRGCPAKASKSKVKAPKLTKTKAIKR